MHVLYKSTIVFACFVFVLTSVLTNSISSLKDTISKKELVNKNCGKVLNSANIGYGTKAELYEFPWMAAIFYKRNGKFGFHCAGSVINQNYILTAAHCFSPNLSDNLSDWKVHVGQQTIGNETTCIEEECSPKYEKPQLDKLIIHPKYDGSNFLQHDIALIRTANPISIDKSHISTVCLPLTKADHAQNFRKITATGWGFTENSTVSNELLKADLDFLEKKDCNEYYQRHDEKSVNDSYMCTKSKTFACYGDSGGPLQFIRSVNETEVRYYQYGIISFGSQCSTYSPVVSTNVSFYIDWILKNIEV